jgi:hypothetical protein
MLRAVQRIYMKEDEYRGAMLDWSAVYPRRVALRQVFGEMG